MFPDLYAHQEWADATVWRDVLASDAARQDKRIRDLLAHLHMTQHAFLAVWSKRDFDRARAKSLGDVDDVRRYARAFHGEVHAVVGAAGESALDQPMPVPWAARFRERPVITTFRETLLQLPMHSAYHRGQVNARLREIGAEPPLVDYIAWIWMGRPAAEW